MPLPSPNRWYLEGFLDLRGGVWRTRVHPLPFRVGRRPACEIRLESGLVSNLHAEIFERDGSLWVRDMGSTNGTFVNGTRVETEAELNEDDLVQFADQEFRVVSFDARSGFRTTMALERGALGPGLLTKLQELGELIRSRRVEVHFQPIVRLDDGAVEGYEVLGRGSLAGREVSPTELLLLAEGGGVVEELSALFRRHGLDAAAPLPSAASIFVNTHPAEIRQPDGLVRSLEELRARVPGRSIVLELHEVAVQDVGALDAVSKAARALDVEIAFDDFGTGHDRLVALAEVHPACVKFDKRLVSQLHLAGARRIAMVKRLVELVRDLGIAPLAEGIETVDEADACRDLGFELAQGYLFGRPAPAETWVRPEAG